MAKQPMMPVNLRVASSLLHQVDERAKQLNRDRSQCIRDAIEAWLAVEPLSLEARVGILEHKIAELGHPVPAPATMVAIKL